MYLILEDYQSIKRLIEYEQTVMKSRPNQT